MLILSREILEYSNVHSNASISCPRPRSCQYSSYQPRHIIRHHMRIHHFCYIYSFYSFTLDFGRRKLTSIGYKNKRYRHSRSRRSRNEVGEHEGVVGGAGVRHEREDGTM